MVVFVDLGDDDDDRTLSRRGRDKLSASQQLASLRSEPEYRQHYESPPVRDADASPSEQKEAEGRPNPNINGFSAALSCYP